jgi:N-acetylneuraminate synthase
MPRLEEPLFVAEISANHLGDLDRAIELVNLAINAGAKAIKFQTYTADSMTLDLNTPEFRISQDHPLWGGEKLYTLYQNAHTPLSWHPKLFQICRSRDVIPFSSPFDLSAVDFLESLDAPMYKIASMETGDIPLIKKVAETGKPLIISTGATEWSEIEDFMSVVEKSGNKNVTLLVCTSSYPSDPKDAHLKRMQKLRENFPVKVGVSDHTLGIGVSIAAIALGAKLVEKHITIKRSDGGPDGPFSMEPHEFFNLVTEGTAAFNALGNSEWTIQDSERESRRLRRSLFITKQVSQGEYITYDNVKSLRPSGGCSPKFLDSIIGKKFKESYVRGTPMSLDYVE